MLTAEQSSKAMTVLAALRSNIEGRSHATLIEGEFYDVYLDNASADLGMSQYTFRSCLSVLAQKGFYKVVDGYAWGSVKYA
jgi:hypothetical protein